MVLTELEPAPGNNARHREDLKDSKKRSQLALVIADLVINLPGASVLCSG